jgi:hypothetical protein
MTLEELSKLDSNWDHNGAVRPSSFVLATVQGILSFDPEKEVTLIPQTNGGVSMCWGNRHEIIVWPSGKMEFHSPPEISEGDISMIDAARYFRET